MQEKMIEVPINRLRQMRDEIVGLRRRNEILFAKVEVMELFGQTLRTQPYNPPQGFAEDIVYMIDEALRAAEKKEAAQ